MSPLSEHLLQGLALSSVVVIVTLTLAEAFKWVIAYKAVRLCRVIASLIVATCGTILEMNMPGLLYTAVAVVGLISFIINTLLLAETTLNHQKSKKLNRPTPHNK